MAINGQIVDEINGLIASRDSIRTTMKAAGIASDTSKLADLATNLANAKLGATTYNVSSSNQTISAGRLTTGAQTIRAVTTSGIEPDNIKYGTTILVGDAGSAGRIKNVAGTFTKEDNYPITAAMVLSGKIGYVNGAKVTGNIPTVTPSATSLNCGKSASISKGYLASDVTITANSLASQTSGTAADADIRSGKTAWVGGTQLTGSMPNATITSGSATISSATYTYNSSNGNFSVTGSATIAAPSVGTAGYISSSAGTRKANTATLSATVAKIAGSTSITGTKTVTPAISKQSISISNVTDAAAGDAQTSTPSSGVWVKVKSDANTGTLTATPSVSADGYGTGSYHGIAAASATVGAAASADTYVPIKTGGVSANNLGTLTKQPSISKQSISISNVTDAAAGNAQTSAPSSGVWVKVKSAANTASYTPSATKTEGWVSGGSVSGTAGTYGASESADTYVPIKTGGVSANNLGTLTKQPSISKQSISISNVTDAAAGNAQTSAPSSGVWVKVKSAANTASYTPSATKTEGWVSGGSVSGTAGTYGASESADTYVPIKNGAYSASVSVSAGSASMSATGVSTATTSNCYITLSTTPGSATGTATVSTAGWVAAGSKSSPTSVSVSGNGDRLYLETYTPSTTTVTNRLQTLTTSGKVCTRDITIPAVNYYYTSLDAPSSTSGYNDGDVWLVVNP